MASVNRERIIPYLVKYRNYLDAQSRGENSIPLSNVKEDYKRNIAAKAADALNADIWTVAEIGKGTIGRAAIKAVQGNSNLIGRFQVTTFADKVKENNFDAEQVLYDLYHEQKEEECFEKLCSLFGRKYDLLAYLYFVLDSNRYLPLRSTIFDSIFEKLDIDFKTTGRCSWENYQEFLSVIETIRNVMAEYYQTEEVDLLDAHSFLWTIHQDVLEHVNGDSNSDGIEKNSVMVTVGTDVYHNYYGFGTVLKLMDQKIYIDFHGRTRIFAYPNAFEKGYLSSVKSAFPQEPSRKELAELTMDDIKHHIMIIKVNQTYKENMDSDALYGAVRGIWVASKERAQTIEYVFGIYQSRIIAVYKPTRWFVCKEAKDKLPREDIVLTSKNENRIFFVDESYEKGIMPDDNQLFYLGKSIEKLDLNIKSQNPVLYLEPKGHFGTRNIYH